MAVNGTVAGLQLVDWLKESKRQVRFGSAVCNDGLITRG